MKTMIKQSCTLLACLLYIARAFVLPSSSSSSSPTRFSLAAERDDFPSFEESLNDQSPKRTAQPKTWQADLDRLMDPTLSVSQRQAILSDLLNANADIRASVETALRDRKIDPLLTPTQRKLQENTRAVARQLRNDILPSATIANVFVPPQLEDFNKIGNRLLNVVSNQLQRNLETLQDDLLHPNNIPQRISQQTSSVLSELKNVVSETPVNLQAPPYTVVSSTDDYELRDYEPYHVATTQMEDASSLAGQAAAFNRLVAYLLGANSESKSMNMTTPVMSTGTGEMRFFVPVDHSKQPPCPLSQDASKYNIQSTQIQLEHIPAARLAVRRFAGFTTANEVARQKSTLLAALQLDRVHLDVPHGQTVGHVIFQYNPPYTVPVLRRNEIAVPVVKVEESPSVEWDYDV